MMKRNQIFLPLFMGLTALVFVAGTLVSWSYTAGSPDACTGSPADKASCAQPSCHEGSAVFKTGLITSNIPEEGYIPGKTYTITGTAYGSPTAKRFGFQISPQSLTGELLGKMVLSDKTQTMLTGKGKYITQKDLGVEGRAYKSWSFNWIAPKAGTGKVTFYGCFLVGGKVEGIFTSKLDVQEAT